MDLSNLKPPEGATTKKKRVGRGPGSTLGKTCGRGQKGQKARSGGTIHPRFEGGQMPIYRRLPKVGFNNSNRKEVAVINVGKLESFFEDGATVDVETFVERGLVKGQFDSVKILGDGDIDIALTVKANAFSASAQQKIEEAGGSVEVV